MYMHIMHQHEKTPQYRKLFYTYFHIFLVDLDLCFRLCQLMNYIEINKFN